MFASLEKSLLLSPLYNCKFSKFQPIPCSLAKRPIQKMKNVLASDVQFILPSVLYLHPCETHVNIPKTHRIPIMLI